MIEGHYLLGLSLNGHFVGGNPLQDVFILLFSNCSELGVITGGGSSQVKAVATIRAMVDSAYDLLSTFLEAGPSPRILVAV